MLLQKQGQCRKRGAGAPALQRVSSLTAFYQRLITNLVLTQDFIHKMKLGMIRVICERATQCSVCLQTIRIVKKMGARERRRGNICPLTF